MPHIIDGYNLLRWIQNADESMAALDEFSMGQILAEYLQIVRDHGHIVFDGIGPPDKDDLIQLALHNPIEIYFSGSNTDADTVIEEKIADNSAPKSLIIVSTDRRIRAAARKRKATSVTSDVFWQVVLNRLEKRKKPSPEPKAKQHGITESETDQWMDLFGLGQ
jgi:uncharacterized protein